MEHNGQDTELYLLVDVDDLLVYSSDKLQEILNKKTNFKTSILRMLEQLNRNCKFFKNQVEAECEFAKSEGEKPNLRRFYILENIKYKDRSEWYTKPVKAANYYVEMADALLNEFLEERDTFLEIDNMPRGAIKKFNYQKEMETILKYAEIINKNKVDFHIINEFCLKSVEDLIFSANISNYVNNGTSLTIPQYDVLVSMDTNDVIKTNSIYDNNSLSYKKYILYKKPVEDIKNCIELEDRLYDIVLNAKVFVTPSREIVDYKDIHSVKNVNWEAVRLVEELIHSKMFKGVYFSTHHNGDREESAKIALMQQIIPEADGFIGQRFHDEEHDGVRRSRSSKIDHAVEVLEVEPEQMILFDDSKANCGDCKDKNGTEILFKPVTDSEKIKGEIENTGYNRIFKFDDDVYGFIAEAYVKPKIKRI